MFSNLFKKKVDKELETEKDKELYIQLEAAYGEEKALKIVKDIKFFKECNPGKYYHFFFSELGDWRVEEKTKTESEE